MKLALFGWFEYHALTVFQQVWSIIQSSITRGSNHHNDESLLSESNQVSHGKNSCLFKIYYMQFKE